MIPLILMTMLAADVYVGTRTREGRSEGIYRIAFNPATGALSDVRLAAPATDPSFLALHQTRPLLYSVIATPEGRVRSFAIEPDGALRPLNEVSSKGSGPAHIQVDRGGRWVAVANYADGSAAVHRIEKDGSLSEAVDTVRHQGRSVNESRQSGPHAHSVYFSADNRHLYIADLGLDEVKVYGFDPATGKLSTGAPLVAPKGAGPRHLAFGARRVYVLNELSSTVSVFEEGQLVETVDALPPGFEGESTAAEVVLDTAGEYLYASHRGADTIAVFRVADRLRKVADVKVGRTPRNFALSPDGRFMLVASQADDTVQSYRVDAATGIPSPVGEPVKVGSPICLRFRPV